MYVRVTRGSTNKYVHQTDEGIAESIFHEAVHALRQGNGNSIEEECDGFIAGLTAAAALRGDPLEPITLNGKPVSHDVTRMYGELARDVYYIPVGATREWLMRVSGLKP